MPKCEVLLGACRETFDLYPGSKVASWRHLGVRYDFEQMEGENFQNPGRSSRKVC